MRSTSLERSDRCQNLPAPPFFREGKLNERAHRRYAVSHFTWWNAAFLTRFLALQLPTRIGHVTDAAGVVIALESASMLRRSCMPKQGSLPVFQIRPIDRTVSDDALPDAVPADEAEDSGDSDESV